MTAVEITVFTKDGGPLTKRISLKSDGTVHSDGSACRMARGQARRAKVAGMDELARVIEQLCLNQAIALGALRSDLPDEVGIIAKDQLNGHEHDIIARTADNIIYRVREPALALLDFDTKGMPNAVAVRVEQAGGFWEALVSVVPALADAARLTRRSTSAGLRRGDTKEEIAGSNGLHAYVVAKDGADIERFLKTLHDRLWLAGLGWYLIDTAGRLLPRSIIDVTVGTGERLVFEGAPVIEPPLEQDEESRRPVVVDGNVLDTLAACPPLTIVEHSAVEREKARAAHALSGEVARARDAFIERRVASGVSRHVAEMQCRGVLLPDVELQFDDDELGTVTVGAVLRDPDRYVDQTLADPVEGDAYRGGPAMVRRRRDGSLIVHSFAHGGSVYEMKYDATAVRAAIEAAGAGDAIATFVKLVVIADLDAVEETELRDLAMERSGSGAKARAVNAMVKAEKKRRADERGRHERERLAAERSDPRAQAAVPTNDAPWQPVMGSINEVLSSSRDAHALSGEVARARDAFIERRVASGVSRHVAEMQCRGVLLPDVELQFDDDELGTVTVGAVLRDPDRYVDQTLADPVEGDAYRGGPAMVRRRRDGSLIVHSFAHGGSVYEMKYDATAVRAAIEAAGAGDAIATFVKLVVIADLDAVEETELRDLAMERSGSGAKARAVNAMVKAEKKRRADERGRHERERLAAERSDPRAQAAVPTNDAPWQPVMGSINEVLSSSRDAKPQSRDIDNDTMRVRQLRLRLTHAFTSAETEQDQ